MFAPNLKCQSLNNAQEESAALSRICFDISVLCEEEPPKE